MTYTCALARAHTHTHTHTQCVLRSVLRKIHTHMMDYYTAIEKNELMLFAQHGWT